jgi:D-glycero-D-manno-heptose 1,7-bisphosphate phosphatase
MPEASVFERYRLVVFDADDTLRQTTVPGKPCPHAPDEWTLKPGVEDLLKGVPWGEPSAPRLGLASNQDHVAYGLVSLEMAQRLLRDLLIAATGDMPAKEALQLCPHAREANCECRKPQPQMLLNIMKHYGVDPEDTLFVGNAEEDREAAARAGVTFMWAADLFGAEELSREAQHQE